MNLLKPFRKKAVPQVKVRRGAKRRPFLRPKSAPAREEKRTPIVLPRELKKRLSGLRRRVHVVAVGSGIFILVGAVSVLVLGQVLADWWFELPWAGRLGFLIGDVVVLAALYRRHLHRALRRRLTLAQMALLVEKKWSRFRQSLVTAVELADAKTHVSPGSPQLVSIMLQQATSRARTLNFKEISPLAPLRRWIVLSGTALLGTLVLGAATWPSSLILIERMFLLNVPLPTRTIVLAVTRDLIVPVGSDAEISAQAQGVLPRHARVIISYLGVEPQEIPLDVQPDQPGLFSFTVRNVQNTFKYQFQMNDGHGEQFTVAARVPPSVAAIACRQIFPDYTKLPPQDVQPAQLSLLAGSHLKVSATATDELKSATVILQGLSQKIDMTPDGSGTKIEADIPIPAKALTGFSLHLVDRDGVASSNETVYPIVLIPDKAPSVTMTQPEEDRETITLRAKPVIAFDASDDYGLAKLTIHYQLFAPAVGGGEAPAPLPAANIPIPVKPSSEGGHYEYTLDVGLQKPVWKEGWTADYWVEATDNNTATGPGVTNTRHKQFGILSLEAKQAEVLQRIRQNADALDALSNTQQKLSNDVGETIPQK